MKPVIGDTTIKEKEKNKKRSFIAAAFFLTKNTLRDKIILLSHQT